MGIKKGYLNRKEIGALIGISSNQIGIMDRDGKLPCAGEILFLWTGKKNMPTTFYPEEPILKWIAKGYNSQPLGRKKKPKPEPTGITFQQIFAGKYLPYHEKMANFSRLAQAQVRRPITQTVRIKGVY